jgi:hypothetical protein
MKKERGKQERIYEENKVKEGKRKVRARGRKR